MPEQLRLDEGLGENRAAHRDERPSPSPAGPVNQVRDELLARARLAGDQDVALPGRDHPHEVEDRARILGLRPMTTSSSEKSDEVTSAPCATLMPATSAHGFQGRISRPPDFRRPAPLPVCQPEIRPHSARHEPCAATRHAGNAGPRAHLRSARPALHVAPDGRGVHRAVWPARLPGTARPGGRARTRAAVAYVHLPFCEARCSFCGCSVIVTEKRWVAARYLEYLKREIELLAPTERPPSCRAAPLGRRHADVF